MPSPYTFGMGGNSMQQPKKAAPANPTLAYAGQRPPAALPADWMQQAASVTDPRAWHTLKAQITRAGQYHSGGGQQALYSNPLAPQFDTETAGPRGGIFSRVKRAFNTTPIASQQGRLAMAKIAAFVGLASAAAAASGAGGAAGGVGGGAGAASAGGGLTASQAAAAGVDPFLVGGGVGGGAAAAGAAGGGGMALSSFGKESLINAGLNLGAGYLGNRAQAKANSQNIDAMKDRIKLALSQLSPEQIMMLVRQYMPQIQAVLGPMQQTALQGLATSQARQGLAGTPYGLTAEAGLRGQFANQATNQAFEQAMGTAGQRASAVTGAPFVQAQPNTAWADAFSNTANQYMLARALSRQSQPWVMPGQATGWQQYEGTPQQWGFYPGRY